jgi:hypothetical protein
LFVGTTVKNVVGAKNETLILDEMTNVMFFTNFELKKETVKKVKKKDLKVKA